MEQKKEMIEKNKNRGVYWRAVLTMLPVVLIAAIVPLIVRQIGRDVKLAQYPWYGNHGEYVEFFLAGKSILLSILLGVMVVIVGIRVWKTKGKLPFAKLLIPMAVYWLFVLLSSLFSINRSYSFLGGYEHFETFFVISSYVMTVYYVFLYAQTKTELRVVVDGICASATVVGILGTLQGIGIDYLSMPMVQKLVTTEKFLQAIGGKFEVNFDGGTAFATMYNPNYLGVYGSFVVPFLVMLVLFDKSKWHKLWHCINVILTIIAMLSSRSRAGLISVGVALLIAAIICFRPIVKWWYLTIPAVTFIIVILLLVNTYNDNIIFGRLQQAFEKESSKEVEVTVVDGTVVRKTGLTELYTSQNGVVFQYNQMRAQISVYVGEGIYGLYAIDETGEQIELLGNEEGTEFVFTDPALRDIRIIPQTFLQGIGESYVECIGFEFQASGKWLFVYNHLSDEYRYITDFGKVSTMVMAKSTGFKDHQSLFSGRGYIWSRSIPLLKKHILLGSGPDTFVFEFPQNDYLMMAKNGYKNSVMTKPHSMYLQIGVQTGVISLLAFLVFYFWYAAQSVRLYFFRPLKTPAEGFGVSTLIGSIGYMISGISNDSMVVTAPVFWVMIGVGIAANAMVKKQRKEGQNVPEETKEQKASEEAVVAEQ